MATADFSRLARVYQALEYIAFGGDLTRVRFSLISALRDCRHILVLGEGDGRFTEQLLRVAPNARIRCIDASPGMIARASARITSADRGRVRFICADARGVDLGSESFDGVVTLFFLDCFRSSEVEQLVERIARQLTPNAVWLFGDFVLPPGGWRRLRARVWLAVLYTFFRLQTGIEVSKLPDAEKALTDAGLHRDRVQGFQHGLLRVATYSR